MDAFSARETSKEFYAAYAGGDGERVAAMIHDDIEWVMYYPVRLFPFSGPRRGKAAVLDVLIRNREGLRAHELRSGNHRG